MFNLQINGANLVITNNLIGQTVDTTSYSGSWFARAVYFVIANGIANLTTAGTTDNVLWSAPLSQLQNVNGVTFSEASLLAFNKASLGQPNVPAVIPVAASRQLTQGDNGATLDCAASVILTIPTGLVNFGIAVRPAGTQVACAGGVTTNGASTTLTTTSRVGAVNPTATSNAYDMVL